MNNNINIFEKISFFVLLITVFLIPLAFTSASVTSLDVVKTTVIVFGTLISGVLFFISSFGEKTLSLPKHRITKAALLVLASLIISAFLSTSVWKSFFGQGFEITTAGFMIVLALVSFLAYHFVKKDKERFLYFIMSIVASFVIVAIFHVIRLFTGPDFMSFGIFQSAVSSPLGKWNDFGVFSIVIALVSYSILRFSILSKMAKSLLVLAFALSLFFVFIINSQIIWMAFGIVMLFVTLYEYTTRSTIQTGFAGFWSKLSVFPILLIILSATLVWKGNAIVGPVVDKLKVSNTELSLPWQLTVDVAAGTTKETPLFGAGPNRFLNQYLKYKPQVVNPSQFWGVEFTNGFGLIPSTLVTQGIVGLIAWIIFIVIFVASGYRSIQKKETGDDGTNNAVDLMKTSSYFTSLFLITISLLYVPSHVVLFLSALFIGLFVSTLSTEEYSLNKKLTPTTLVVLIALSVFFMAIYVKKIVAIGYFQSGITSLGLNTPEGLNAAEVSFKNAISFDNSDIYYQALSENMILKIKTLSEEIQKKSQDPAKPDTTEDVKKIGTMIEQGVVYSRSAIALDPTNYYNHLSEARISEVAASLQVKNGYENTKNAYGNAITINPYNPSLYLSLARFEASQNKMAEAQQFIGNALQLKQNYLDAVFLLAQIQVSQGKTKDAINSVIFATQVNPNDATLFFQLGILFYNDKDYANAVIALEQAVKLNNQYANAKYFLGLSYARLEKTKDAIINFEALAKTNPDNEEVALILANLKADKPIFNDAKPPIDSKPEKRSTLPIQETKADVKSSVKTMTPDKDTAPVKK